MGVLSLILQILSIASASAQAFLVTNPTGESANNLASALIQIVQKAMQAYEAQTGKPIDPTLLKPFTPIE